jgi:class 3 adenylate cyclase
MTEDNIATRTCPSCGAVAAPDASFCHRCGKPLGGPAPATDNLTRYIPPELLRKLEQARANQSVSGERRIVTMLFCDVKGSTAMAETLDPEDWAEIMNGTFEYLIKPVYRYEGTLARLMGDAILAFFGAPIAHEDDPQRAVLAGLEIVHSIQPHRQAIKRTWGFDFDVRVGINTGLVVVGEVGSDLRVEYTAMGDAVNLAARMEQTAQPGTVQVSENTYRLISRAIDCESLGLIEVKGKQEPVAIYRALALKQTSERFEDSGQLRAPLSGRGLEMGQLSSAWAGVEAGRGALVCLIGEAGLGKSRMIRELRAELGGAQQFAWNEVASLSYDSGRPYGLFQRQLRQMCAITDSLAPDVVRLKVEQAASRLPGEWPERGLRIYQALLGVQPDDASGQTEGEAFKRELFDVAYQTYRALAGSSPAVLVFEDLHWIDHASLEMLEYLLRLTVEGPVLILCTLRPDPQSPGWRMLEHARLALGRQVVEITLKPLDGDASSRLFDSLITADDLPPALREQIIAKAEGNPFYIEEVLRNLIDEKLIEFDPSQQRWKIVGPVAGISLPVSLQASVTARVDRLQEQSRRALQTAAVIGRSFYERVLRGVLEADGWLDSSLAELEGLGLIQEQPGQAEREYMFSHALTHEATYQAILRKVRRQLHRKTGETLEQLFADRLDDQAALLAYHFFEANDPAHAHPYYVRAADRAGRLYANADAAAHYRRALDTLDRGQASTGDLIHLYTRLGTTLSISGEYDLALAGYQAMESLAQERNDQALQLAAVMELATLRSTPTPLYDIPQAEALSGQALDLSRRLQDRVAESKILWNLMLLHSFDSQMGEAVSFGEKSLTLARELGLKEQVAFTLNDLNRAYRNIGALDSARAALDEARGMWRDMGNLPMLTDNLGSSASLFFLLGEYEQGLAYADEGCQISRKIHNAWGEGFNLNGAAQSYFELGQFSQAINAMEGSVRVGEQIGVTLILTAIKADLAWMVASVGDTARGLELAEQALARTDDPALPAGFKQWAYAGAARVYAESGDLTAAQSAIDIARANLSFDGPTTPAPTAVLLTEARLAVMRQAYASAVTTVDTLLDYLKRWQIKSYVAEALLLKGEALSALGKIDEAYECLSEARDICHTLGSQRILWQILLKLSDTARQRGDAAGADQLHSEARAVFDALAAQIEAPELRRMFMALFPG